MKKRDAFSLICALCRSLGRRVDGREFSAVVILDDGREFRTDVRYKSLMSVLLDDVSNPDLVEAWKNGADLISVRKA